jgi:NADH:ubiquinone oxidoreductase subunit 2 (subunit N)
MLMAAANDLITLVSIRRSISQCALAGFLRDRHQQAGLKYLLGATSSAVLL